MKKDMKEGWKTRRGVEEGWERDGRRGGEEANEDQGRIHSIRVNHH